jgi:hypothetical protein
MTWEEFQKFIKGKVFLIGLTFVDSDEQLIEQYQTSGTVEKLDDSGIFKFRRLDGSIFQLPYDQETINEAYEGEYRERETGNIITNPDFITTWKIVVNNADNLEEMKLNGYNP